MLYPNGEIAIIKENDMYIPMLRSESLDKNGKYIYDGDIIKYDDTYLSGFGARTWAGNLRRIEHFGDFYEHGKNHYFRHLTFTASLCEVIGNIYENPELLD